MCVPSAYTAIPDIYMCVPSLYTTIPDFYMYVPSAYTTITRCQHVCAHCIYYYTRHLHAIILNWCNLFATSLPTWIKMRPLWSLPNICDQTKHGMQINCDHFESVQYFCDQFAHMKYIVTILTIDKYLWPNWTWGGKFLAINGHPAFF